MCCCWQRNNKKQGDQSGLAFKNDEENYIIAPSTCIRWFVFSHELHLVVLIIKWWA